MKESDPIPPRPRRRRRLGCLSAQRDEMRPGKRCTAPGREGETSRCMARLRRVGRRVNIKASAASLFPAHLLLGATMLTCFGEVNHDVAETPC